MLGFSLTKLLFTIVVVFVIWNGFKWYARMQVMNDRNNADRLRRATEPGTSPRSKPVTEKMVKCSVCGAYVTSKGASSCGRDDCPHSD